MRATVIIPTFGNALFARWAVGSVQRQTVEDLEICIVCDGSPAGAVAMFREMAAADRRIRVFVFPKPPRTGEPYRDLVIGQTTGPVICYCSHDDLWFPHHVEAVERSLPSCRFTHSLHVSLNPPAEAQSDDTLLGVVHWADLRVSRFREMMFAGYNSFGLTFGAHTREAYDRVGEGWITTPPGIPTDLYMWQTLLAACKGACRTTSRITALCFPQLFRNDLSGPERDAELACYFEKMADRAFLKKIETLALRRRPTAYQRAKAAFDWKLSRFVGQLADGRSGPARGLRRQ